MLFKVVRALLSPWVRRQGLAVQRRTASLPEPAGSREGVSGIGKVCLRVLIVGDSSAAGVGAESQSQALSGRLGEALSQRLGGAVVWQVIARRGDTTVQSLEALRRLPLRPADVMVTTLGLTEMIAQVSPRRWLDQLDQLDRAAARVAGVQHIVHCGMPPVHSFALPNPLRWVLAHGQRRYNQALADWCDRWPERWWLPLPYENLQATDSVLMADDGFHPGPAVYALWAEQLAAIISTQIVPRLTETTPTRQLVAQAEARRRMRGTP